MLPFETTIYGVRMMMLLSFIPRAIVATGSCNNSLAVRMLESTIARGQGFYNTAASTSLIELGIFQQALHESIAVAANSTHREEWTAYLNESTTSVIQPLSNATEDASLPLDRLSIGSALVYEHDSSQNENFLPAIQALAQSVHLQQRNANGGLWYYADPKNLSYYHNLSYLDGMYSYPPFAVLPTAQKLDTQQQAASTTDLFGPAAVLEQLQRLYERCIQPSGLLVHGYDASKAHNWSNPVTGASPIVWGRSLAWYTLGIVNALGLLHSSPSNHTVCSGSTLADMKNLFNEIVKAQIAASEHSFQQTGSYGVWQVVDRPGDSGNFVEASASCMMAYSLLRAVRLQFIDDLKMRHHAVNTALGIYRGVQGAFLSEASNGTLSLNGTSSVASLSGESVDYEVSIVLRDVGCEFSGVSDLAIPVVLYYSTNRYQ